MFEESDYTPIQLDKDTQYIIIGEKRTKKRFRIGAVVAFLLICVLFAFIVYVAMKG